MSARDRALPNITSDTIRTLTGKG